MRLMCSFYCVSGKTAAGLLNKWPSNFVGTGAAVGIKTKHHVLVFPEGNLKLNVSQCSPAMRR